MEGIVHNEDIYTVEYIHGGSMQTLGRIHREIYIKAIYKGRNNQPKEYAHRGDIYTEEHTLGDDIKTKKTYAEKTCIPSESAYKRSYTKKDIQK